MRNDFYVYIYLDPTKPGEYTYGQYKFMHEPMYVGKGIDARIDEHIKESKKHTKRQFLARLRAIIKGGKEVIRYKLYEDINNTEACQYEIELITLIGRKCRGEGPLYNITNGGDGGDTFTNNPDKEKIREKLMGRTPWNKSTKGISKANKTSFGGTEKINEQDWFIEKRLSGLRSDKCKQKMIDSARSREKHGRQLVFILEDSVTGERYTCIGRSGVVKFLKEKYDLSFYQVIISPKKMSPVRLIQKFNRY